MMWSNKEKEIARRAFEKAQEREGSELIGRLKKMLDSARNFEDIWAVHDLLTQKRKEISQKYDYRYSVLIRVFGRLLGEGRIGLDALEGLDDDKVAAIRIFAGA